MIWDNQAKHATKDREFRLALLASGKVTPEQAFPELFPDAESSEDDAEIETYEYVSPAENFEDIMAQLHAHRTITTREGSGTPEGVTEEISLGPDDAEWI